MIYHSVGLRKCITCKYYIDKGSCEAYPRRIPRSILQGLNDHSKPLEAHIEIYHDVEYEYPSDNGIIYEAKA